MQIASTRNFTMAVASKVIAKIDGALDKVLNKNTINPNLVRAEYAVRGELAIRAEELKEELRLNPGSHPFDKVTFCNIGNPQQLGQKPVTFFRQMLSLIEWPELAEQVPKGIFPADVVRRAYSLLNSIGTMGAYSHSQGVPLIRQEVADFLLRRDGVASNIKQIFLTNGASDGITRILECLITSERIGIMIPIPQYPLYSAAIRLLGGTMVPYYLNEDASWSLETNELDRAYEDAKQKGIEPRAMVIINPGNPSGSIFNRETLVKIAKFCERKRLVLFSDEVYQMNVYNPQRPFISARKVVSERGLNVEVFSFHSISKGLIGECGHRGAFYECYNIDPEVVDLLYKQASIKLCSNLAGQLMLSLMVNPPQSGDESFELYEKEVKEIKGQLMRRAHKLQEAFSMMTNVTCNDAHGAMYLFPRIRFPEKFLHHAQSLQKPPDEIYAMDLLNATGICVVPGSGFGQALGTFHIRTTFLPPENYFDTFIAQWRSFHEVFMRDWAE